MTFMAKSVAPAAPSPRVQKGVRCLAGGQLRCYRVERGRDVRRTYRTGSPISASLTTSPGRPISDRHDKRLEN